MVARWGDSERHRRKRMVLIRNTLPVWSGPSESIAVTRFDTYTNITIRANLSRHLFLHVLCPRYTCNCLISYTIRTGVTCLWIAWTYARHPILLFMLFPLSRQDRGQPVAGRSVVRKDKTVHGMNNMNISKESKDGLQGKVRIGRYITLYGGSICTGLSFSVPCTAYL